MEQNNQTNATTQFEFADFVRIFSGKIKFLVCITLIAAIIGAAVGVLFAFFGVTYGNEIQFSLNPGENAHMLLPTLQSDSFAEKLLLDENGLPPAEDCNAEDYNSALDAVKAANAARQKKQQLRKELDMLPYSIALIEDQYNNLTSNYNRVKELLDIYKSAATEEIAKDPNHITMIAKYEAELTLAAAARDEYEKNTYNPAIQNKLQLEEEYAKARVEMNDTRLDAEEKVEKVLSDWRNDPEVRELISVIKKSVKYEYAKILDTETVTDGTENQNSGFLVVSISVERDKEAAEFVIDRIKARTPDFIEREIERITGTNEARCALISTFANVKTTSEESPLKNIVIFAAITAIGTLAIACVLIFIKATLPSDVLAKKETKNKSKKAVDTADDK